MHVCPKCDRSFVRLFNLTQHLKTCVSDEHVCPKCNQAFAQRTNMLRHLRLCGDAAEGPPNRPDADDDLQSVVRDYWASIRTSVERGPVQSRYNFHLTGHGTTSAHDAQLRLMFEAQTRAFKINLSYGFILRHRETGRLRYYHSSCNCCGRYLESPVLVSDAASFERFLEATRQPDVLQYVIAQRPDSGWIAELVTNVTYFLNAIIHHPIGCARQQPLPAYLRHNAGLVSLVNDRRGHPYADNLCLFRCLALHRGADFRADDLTAAALRLYADYGDQPYCAFAGVPLNELDRVEAAFETNVTVYRLSAAEDATAEVVRRSLHRYPATMSVNLFGTHYSFIADVSLFCRSYRCGKCGDSLWRTASRLRCHEATCEGGVRHVFPGGVYHPTPSVFQQLEDEGVYVDERLRYYPYRATYDFECYFDDHDLPADSAKRRWIARHELLSVSVASNVPGHESARCFVTSGDSGDLAKRLIDALEAMSEAACAALRPSFDATFEAIDALDAEWRAHATVAELDKSPYTALGDRLWQHLRRLPVLGFNSGKYDLNVVKKYLTPLFMTDAAQDISSAFTIKRQNNFMCLTTATLKFLDITNYLAPGVSYDRFLKAYGCEATKGHFPYEYLDDPRKLAETRLPPREAFYSRLKCEGISAADYEGCARVWRDEGMTTLRDYLVWYNNRDVVPFLEALDKQFAFYRQRRIDMFKDAISVPGLTLLYLFNDLPSSLHFTLFNESNKDLHRLLQSQIVGGPSIISSLIV